MRIFTGTLVQAKHVWLLVTCGEAIDHHHRVCLGCDAASWSVLFLTYWDGVWSNLEGMKCLILTLEDENATFTQNVTHQSSNQASDMQKSQPHMWKPNNKSWDNSSWSFLITIRILLAFDHDHSLLNPCHGTFHIFFFIRFSLCNIINMWMDPLYVRSSI